MTELNGFLHGIALLNNEFAHEDEIEKATDTLLAQGQLGNRSQILMEELGSALSLCSQVASCQGGCRGGNHTEENLIRRLANYSFAALRLAKLGLPNEAIAMLRSTAELVNLIELFTLRRSEMDEWLNVPQHERWKKFKPDEVNKKIVRTRNRPIVDRITYSKLCEIGPHVSPESVDLSHQFEGAIFVGGEFSIAAFLMILNELAIMVSACLKLIGYFVEAPKEKIELLTTAGEKLEQNATDWIRITNYEQRLKEQI